MMTRIDKSLLKLWVWFIACIIAYNPEPLAGESPDIDVAMTIPELDPLQFLTNRKLMRNYFGGRNVVVTQDKTMARIMVVTGWA